MAHTRTTPSVRLDEIRGRATIPVWHATEPSLDGVLGVGRATAYAMAERDEVPGVLRIGARVVIACPSLLAWLGETTPLIGTQAEPAGHAGCSHELTPGALTIGSAR
jgi:hypothetical protein